jgi:hypothetical protein
MIFNRDLVRHSAFYKSSRMGGSRPPIADRETLRAGWLDGRWARQRIPSRPGRLGFKCAADLFSPQKQPATTFTVVKDFVDQKPRTRIALTRRGRKALARHLGSILKKATSW